MPSVKFRLLGGVSAPIGRSGPEYADDSMNWYGHAGTLKKRAGSRVFRTVPAEETTAGVYVSFSPDYTTGPVTSVGALPLVSGAGLKFILIGADAPFCRFRIAGLSNADSVGNLNLAALGPDMSIVQYGCFFMTKTATDYDSIYPANGFSPIYNSANDTACIVPYGAHSGSLGGGQVSGTMFECAFEPPSGWVTQTIGGQTKYWVTITIDPVTQFNTATITSAAVCLTENRVLNVLAWQDRAGTPHDLVVSLYGNTGKQLRYMLDGTTLTQSVDLQPDGNSRVFGPDTKITTAYHGATDRVVGYISNFGWFYLIPGDGNVYNLAADPIGTDTPFQGLKGGLAGAIPEADGLIIADSRIFSWKDQTLRWSAFGPYIDVWANASTIFVDDGLGPITGAAVVGGSIILFKRKAIYAVQQNGKDVSEVDYDTLALSNNIGAVGGICGAGDEVFFVGESGYYHFNGKSAEKLTTKIDEKFLAGVLGINFAKAQAVFYAPLGQMRIFYPVESENLLDGAVYVNASESVTPGDDDGDGNAFSVWPQGRVLSTQPGEYGFQGSAVCCDSTGIRPRILLGDRYGFVWEMDSGYYDGGKPVVADITQSQQNYAGNSKVLAGPTYVSQNGQMTDNSMEITLIPNGQAQQGKAITCYPYERGMSRGHASVTSNSANAKPSQAGVTKRLNHAVRCHSFAVRLVDDVAGMREITGISVEVIPVGDRGF